MCVWLRPLWVRGRWQRCYGSYLSNYASVLQTLSLSLPASSPGQTSPHLVLGCGSTEVMKQLVWLLQIVTVQGNKFGKLLSRRAWRQEISIFWLWRCCVCVCAPAVHVPYACVCAGCSMSIVDATTVSYLCRATA